jgi:lysophospholipase
MKVLLEVGVIPGADMTVEAALSKLSYVLGLDVSIKEKQRVFIPND